ncbi:hypothetical protein H4R34_004878 [Dimargaris verticillata]|uniref:Uncharacterized protein n=1 Tax=Dimargaris verticillata TaxID=2761393 RepID=A0A9W8AY22_9FUNG|nr:hypothetical protein H4R34_004878 [Dimargaris verticillata]
MATSNAPSDSSTRDSPGTPTPQGGQTRPDATFSASISSAQAAANQCIRELQSDPTAMAAAGRRGANAPAAASSRNGDTDFDALLEWDESIELMLQSTEDEFFHTQTLHAPQPLSSSSTTGPTTPGPTDGQSPRRWSAALASRNNSTDTSTWSKPHPINSMPSTMDRLTAPSPARTAQVASAPSPGLEATSHTAGKGIGRQAKELMGVQEELSRLHDENRQLSTEKSDLLNLKYTHEGEIAIIRKRLVKSETENAQLQERINTASMQSSLEKETLQRAMSREVERLRTELEFKSQELIAAQMTPRSVVINTGPPPSSSPTPSVSTPVSSRAETPPSLGRGFLDSSAFYAPPPQPHLHPQPATAPPLLTKSTASVGVMTDQSLLPPSGSLSAAKPDAPSASAQAPSVPKLLDPVKLVALVITDLQARYSEIPNPEIQPHTIRFYPKLLSALSMFQSEPQSNTHVKMLAIKVQSLVTAALTSTGSVQDQITQVCLALAALVPLVYTNSGLRSATYRTWTDDQANLQLLLAVVLCPTAQSDQPTHDSAADLLAQLILIWLTHPKECSPAPLQMLIQPPTLRWILTSALDPHIRERYMVACHLLCLANPAASEWLGHDPKETHSVLTLFSNQLSLPTKGPTARLSLQADLALESAIIGWFTTLVRFHEPALVPIILQHRPLIAALLQLLTQEYEQLTGLVGLCSSREQFVVDTLDLLHIVFTRRPRTVDYLLNPDTPLVDQDSDVSSDDSHSLFYQYVNIVSCLAFGHDESGLLNSVTDKAGDLLALVVTPQEEEDIMTLAQST